MNTKPGRKFALAVGIIVGLFGMAVLMLMKGVLTEGGLGVLVGGILGISGGFFTANVAAKNKYLEKLKIENGHGEQPK